MTNFEFCRDRPHSMELPTLVLMYSWYQATTSQGLQPLQAIVNPNFTSGSRFADPEPSASNCLTSHRQRWESRLLDQTKKRDKEQSRQEGVFEPSALCSVHLSILKPHVPSKKVNSRVRWRYCIVKLLPWIAPIDHLHVQVNVS